MNGTEGLQFVDTNVLVYAHDISAGQKRSRAQDLIKALWLSGTGCLSIQVLQEFYVATTQKVARPLPTSAASQIVADLSVWKVDCPTVEGVLHAIRLQERYRISYWDAMILASAIRLGCQIIWSEDLNAGQVYDRLVVRNPF